MNVKLLNTETECCKAEIVVEEIGEESVIWFSQKRVAFLCSACFQTVPEEKVKETFEDGKKYLIPDSSYTVVVYNRKCFCGGNIQRITTDERIPGTGRQIFGPDGAKQWRWVDYYNCIECGLSYSPTEKRTVGVPES